MMMDEIQLLIDLHKDGKRQGPGGDDETRLAISLSGLKGKSNLKIADIGCGTGASTLVLAQELKANITAIDFLPEFLERLKQDVSEAGLSEKVTTLAESMEKLPFSNDELDAIWAEGAIYNMGFEAGVKAWRPFLKEHGILAASEITWLTDKQPDELQSHWNNEYPEIGTASEKIAVLEKNGYTPVGYFPLPEHCWMENYYNPMRERFESFLKAYDHSEAAQAIVAAEENEISLYERYRDYVSYGFYIARKVGR
jgi:ubiquinone/menaquinone biosynthesis C-methylase UbiE